jgi:arylsulfatase
LPTLAAAAGAPDIKEKLKTGVELNGRKYRNYIDGYNMLDYFSGKVAESPRNEFWYCGDEGQVVAARYQDWKVVFLENRADRLQIWKEPFVELRAPDLYNLRRDPFEKAKIGSNTYEDWYIDRAFIIIPIQGMAANFLRTMAEFPPSQKPGSWNLSRIEESLRSSAGSK